MKTLKRNALTLTVILLIIVAIGVVVAWFPREAKAQMACMARGDIAETLLNGYGEQTIWRGVTSTGSALLIFANPETGSWTLVAVFPNPQRECVMSSGEGAETVKPKKESY